MKFYIELFFYESTIRKNFLSQISISLSVPCNIIHRCFNIQSIYVHCTYVVHIIHIVDFSLNADNADFTDLLSFIVAQVNWYNEGLYSLYVINIATETSL